MTGIVLIERGGSVPPDTERMGGKAAQQALAAADDLPIPKGLVLTTDAFPGKDWLDRHSGLPSDEQGRAVAKHLRSLGVDLLPAVQYLDGGTYAVRSSATTEDMDVASFAGSFISALDVPRHRLHEAIYRVWASLYGPRVSTYLRDRGLASVSSTQKMAVLIQSMIKPLISGVGLSHPLGRPDDPFLSIGIVRGLGDKLVGGTVSPEAYSIERGTWAIVEHSGEPRLTAIMHEAGAEIGRTIEFLELMRGSPQDIEFVITKGSGGFVLLQNRPIVPRMERR